ncbi:MAG: spore germination protein GerW family protein [Bacillota bacterium]|nr:spore germination protein GerW family protein [Bacillota bacterium]
MDQFNLADNVNTLFQSLENFTQKEGVIGKPVSQSDKTFLPVVSVTVGYGGGNASMKGQSNTSSTTSYTSGTTGSTGNGSGALGLGAKLNTEAIILIDKDNVSVLPMSGAGAGATQIIDKLPQIVSGLQNKGQQGSTSSTSSASM